MKVIRNLDRGTANAIIYGFDNDNIDYFRNKYNILKSTLKNDNNEFTGFYNTLEYQNSDRYIAEIKSKMFELGVSGRDDINLYYYFEVSLGYRNYQRSLYVYQSNKRLYYFQLV